MTTRAASKPSTTSVALGTMNSRVTTSGVSDDDRTDWLLSARAWYPDAFLPDVNTDYYDLIGKLQRRMGSRTLASLKREDRDAISVPEEISGLPEALAGR